jgi:hypothetical protein
MLNISLLTELDNFVGLGTTTISPLAGLWERGVSLPWLVASRINTGTRSIAFKFGRDG